jgi:peroxiredoxin
MNRRISVILITVLGLGSIWGVVQMAPQQPSGMPVQAASSGSNAPVSVSPNLQMTEASQFLDPIPVGRKVPDFTLQNATTGKPFKLSTLRGKKNVVMVFYQGSFCPVCGKQLENLQRHLTDFNQQNTEVVAISGDALTSAQKTVGEHGLSFNVLSDPGHKVIKLFGVANITRGGIAWPSSFVVDKQGVVRLSVADPSGKRLHSNGLLPTLSKLTGKPSPQLSYDQ